MDDFDLPKKTKHDNAFFLYREEVKDQAEFKNDKGKQDLKKIGLVWASMSADDKQPYNDLAKQNKKEYEDELKEWASAHPDAWAAYLAAKVPLPPFFFKKERKK